MRFVLAIIVIGAILYGAYAYLNRDRGEDPVHKAYCEELRQELANGDYLGEGEFNFSYGDRVRLTLKGCLQFFFTSCINGTGRVNKEKYHEES